MSPRYSLNSDIVRATDWASIGVASGGESVDPDYQLASLHDLEPENPFKALDGSVALDIVWAAVAKIRIEYVGLSIHNIVPGKAVLFQGNNLNVWEAPLMNAPITIGPALLSGHSRAPWKDLAAVEGYDPDGFLFYRLHVPANDGIPVQLGEVVLSRALRTLPVGIGQGMRPRHRHPVLQGLKTGAEFETRYRLPIFNRSFQGQCGDALDLAVWLDLHAETGGCDPFVWVQDPSDETDGGWLAQFAETTARDLEWSYVTGSYKPVDIEIQEICRGLPL
jgi:hypothetical protein